MIPSPVYWFTVPSKRCTPSARIVKKRSRIRCHSSGSTCSASSIEPFTSAKRTVTCFRSPSRAASEGGVSPLAGGTRAATCAGASDGARVTLTVRSSDLLADYLPLFPLERRHGDPAPLLGRPDQGGVHELQHRALPESVRDHLHPAPFFAEEPFQEICGPNHLAMTNGEAQMCRARREVLPTHWRSAGSSRAYREAKSSRSALASSGEGVSYGALARARNSGHTS